MQWNVAESERFLFIDPSRHGNTKRGGDIKVLKSRQKTLAVVIAVTAIAFFALTAVPIFFIHKGESIRTCLLPLLYIYMAPFVLNLKSCILLLDFEFPLQVNEGHAFWWIGIISYPGYPYLKTIQVVNKFLSGPGVVALWTITHVDSNR